MKVNRVFVLGGDLRSVYMADYFRKKGLTVDVYGHGASNETLTNIPLADLIVLGLPAVKDKVINMPLCKEELLFSEFMSCCTDGVCVAGGRFTPNENVLANIHGIKLFDYSEDEIFKVENALYTAEGAIATLIENTKKSICNMKILITGYGRISKTLCLLLANWPCELTVYARNNTARTWCKMQGIKAVEDLTDLFEYDAIINTVPAHILRPESLCTVNKNSIVLDLSQRPGYVDKNFCSEHNIKLLYLPGIPLLSAPQSAGITAAKAVERFTEGK